MFGTSKFQRVVAANFVGEAISKLNDANSKLRGQEQEIVEAREELTKLVASLQGFQAKLSK